MKQNNKKTIIRVDESYIVPVFRPLYTSTERTVLLWGGASSGKSYAAFQRMIIKALESKRRILVVRKVASTLRNSVFQLTKEIAESMGIDKLNGYKVTTSELKITLPNGSTFLYMGMDDSEKMKSITSITDIIIEECTEIDEADFKQLQMRLRSKVENSQIYMMMNPISKANWVYGYFFKDDTPPNTLLHHSTYLDNLENQSPAFIEQMEYLKKADPDYYQIYGRGEFANLDAPIFSNWKVEEVEDKGDLWIGCDFGFSNDPTAIIGCYVEGTNLYVVDEIYRKGMFIDDIANAIKSKDWDRYDVFCDSAEPRSIADLKRNGIKSHAVKKGKDSVTYGIEWLKKMHIIIDPKCENLIREMENYSWMKDKDGIYINKPKSNSEDHGIDAMRYSCSMLMEKSKSGKIIFLDKSMFGIW